MAKKLTTAEEEIMLILWKLKEGTARDVLNELDEPDTPYTTVSTVIRVLEKKGFVCHRAVGTTYIYYPIVAREEYLKGFISKIVSSYFEGSFSRMASFFAKENDLSLDELRELLDVVEQELDEDREHE